MNDALVTECSIDEAMNQNAYILFYEQTDEEDLDSVDSYSPQQQQQQSSPAAATFTSSSSGQMNYMGTNYLPDAVGDAYSGANLGRKLTPPSEEKSILQKLPTPPLFKENEQSPYGEFLLFNTIDYNY